MTVDQTSSDDRTFDAEGILAAAVAMQPLVRENAEEVQEARTLTPVIVDAMRDAGVFRMVMPRDWGGPELDPMQQFEVIEALSRADGSVGWCSYINSTAGYFTAFIDQDVARPMYPSLDIPTGGMPIPVGRAQVVDGGYRVSGHWTFGSGVMHCGWMVCGCVVRQGDDPVLDDAGKPVTRTAFVSSDQFEVVDTWNAMGLRGTGSHDWVIDDVFVPQERTFDLYTSPIRRTGPTFGLRTMFMFNHAAIACGIARNALDAFADLALAKRTVWGPMHEQEFARSALARADGILRSARGFCLETLGDVYDTLAAGDEVSVHQRAQFRLAITHVHRAAVEAVDGVFEAAGTTAAVRLPSVLERCFRDIHVANQHLIASPKSYSEIGGMLLGTVPADPNY